MDNKKQNNDHNIYERKHLGNFFSFAFITTSH